MGIVIAILQRELHENCGCEFATNFAIIQISLVNSEGKFERYFEKNNYFTCKCVWINGKRTIAANLQ